MRSQSLKKSALLSLRDDDDDIGDCDDCDFISFFENERVCTFYEYKSYERDPSRKPPV